MATRQRPAKTVQPKKRVARKVLVHLRLSDQDRDRFGGPEWVTYDYDDMVSNLPASDIADLERQIRRAEGETIAVASFASDWNDLSAVAVKARLWFARRAEGLVDTWAEFDPHILQVQYRIEAIFEDEGGDPLDPGSGSTPTTPAA